MARRSPRDRARLLLIAALVLPAAAPVAVVARQDSDDPRARSAWRQWRGPQRDGVAAAPLPDGWHTDLEPRWRVPVGIGHASPIVAGDRVWQFARSGERESLRALRLDSGETIWEVGHEVPYTMNPAARGHGKGPKSTPALVDGRVFTLGIAGALTAHDADTGEVLWRHDFAGEFRSTSATFGSAMSPIVLDARVIAHLGGAGDGALAAFDVASGERVWVHDSDGPAYASPVLVRIDGVAQLVTQTEAHVLAVDPDDGRELWKIPFTTPYEQNSVTPLAVGERLLLSGLDQGLFAVRPRLRDGVWQVQELWRNRDVSLYMSSPVLAAGRVFGMSHRRAGQFFALDPDTGELLWTSTGREGDNASLVVAGDQILFLTDGAELVVVPVAGDEYRPAARREVADTPTWAHPVPTASGLLIKELEHLSLLAF